MKSPAFLRRFLVLAALVVSVGTAFAANSVVTASVNGAGTQIVGAGSVQFVLASQGTEAGVGFSVTFDPSVLRYDGFTNGSGLSGAAINVNNSQATSGKVGVALALSSGTFTAGNKQLVLLNFTVLSVTGASTAVGFGDAPIAREISDVAAEVLPSTFNGLTISALPVLTAAQLIPSKSLTSGFAAPAFTPVTPVGGTSPYSFSINPALPTGLAIGATTGAVTGIPTGTSLATTYTVTITDSATPVATATNTFSLTINSALVTSVTTASKALTINTAAIAFTPVSASAGTSPYTFTVSPALPTGLSLDPSTGAVSGTPTVTSASAAYTVTATDAVGATSSKTFTLVVNPALVATQTAASPVLTAANGAASAFVPVTGFGGTTAYTYSINPALPSALVFNPVTGSVSGTPAAAQTATTYTVTVADAAGAVATNTFSLTINPAISATQTVSTKGLTLNTTAIAFTPVTVGGGTSPFNHTIAPALPAGLSIAAGTGVVSGTPAATAAAANYTVTITDSKGAQASSAFNLTVNPALSSVQAVASRALTINTATVAFTPVTTAGGTSPVAYSVTPPLPTGLSLSASTGQVSGAPSVTAATDTYTVTATDAAGATTSKAFDLTVNAAVVATQAIASRTLTAGGAIAAFIPVTGSGGTAPLSYSVSPALPAGLTMVSSTGSISGNPTGASSLATYTVTVTDGAGATATATFALTVNGPLTASIVSANRALTANATPAPFAPIVGAGGTAPYTYSVAPALPAGLTFSASTGSVSGTPTAAAIAANFTVTVTDSASATASAAFSLTINQALVAGQTVAAKTLTAGAAAVSFVPVTGSLGTAPYIYSVSPTLPATLTLNPTTGAITGTATTASSAATYTVTVADNAFATAENTFSLTVNGALSAGSTLASRTLTAGAVASSFTPLGLTGGTTPYAWSVSPPLPAALGLNPLTGAIAGTPSASQSSANYTITGTDANGAQVSQAFALLINAALTTTQAVATVGPLSAGTAIVGSVTPVTAAGGTTPYTFAVTPALPTGLSLNPATGAITGTPASAASTATYTVTATDSVGATSAKTFSLTVNGPLAATQAIASKSITATTAVVGFTPVTAGGGTTPYAFSVAPALPAGLSLSTSSGAITGTATTASAAATYTVTITDAASGSVNSTFSLTVNPALTSTLDVATKGLTVGSAAVAFTPVSAAGGTTPYAFSVTPALPAGLSLNATTGVVSGTPTAAATTANYTITVTDAANATTTKILALAVNAPPTPVAGQTVASKSLTASSNIVAFTPLPLNGGTLPFTYTVNPSLPAGLSLNATTGAISGNATAAVASAVYVITATDAAGATATQNLTLVVNPALVATQAIASKILLINTAATAFTPVTIAGGTSPFTYAVAPTLAAGLTFNTTSGAVSGTPTVTTAAVTHTVTITDAAGATANASFSLKVNQVPAITTPPTANPSYLVGAPLTLTVVATGSPAPTYQWRKSGTDLPGKTASTLVFAALALTDAGSYDVVVTNESGTVTSTPAVSFLVYLPPTITTQPANQTVVAGSTATISVVAVGDPTPTYQWRRNGLNVFNATGATLTLGNVAFDGGGVFTVLVSNPGGSVTSNPATLTVNPVAPVINSPTAVTAILGRSFLFQVSSTATSATYAATGLPAGLLINTTSGAISGIPTASGVFPVSVTATNVTGSDTRTLTITVNPPPPIINSAAAAAGRVGVSFNFAVQAVNSPSSYTASGLPSGLSIISGTGVISGTPAAGTAGVYSVTLSATNAGGTTTSPLQITIDPALNAPTFAGNTNLSGKQNVAFTYAPAFGGAPFTGSFFTASGLPAGLTLSSATSTGATISGTPTVTGSFTIVITATNAGGSTAVTFNLTVNPADSAPVITSASTAATAVGAPFTFQLTSAGTPGATSYAASGLPSLGLTLNTSTGAISGPATSPGTLTLQVRATSTAGTGPQSVLVISVSPSASAPVITSSPVAPGQVGVGFTYQLVASNSPTGFLQTSGTLPAGLAFDAATGAITGTPTQVGQTRVWFAGDSTINGRGLALEVLFNIAAASTTPVITSNGTAAAQVGQPFQYLITATNGPIDSFSATALPPGLTLASGTGVISGLPTTPGNATVTLTATKGTDVSTPKSLTLSVAPAPATPVITSSLNVAGRVGTAISYTVSASENATSFVGAKLPAGLTLDPSTGVLSGSPTESGLIASSVRAGNSSGLGAAATINFNIAAAAAAPVITSAPAASGKVGAATAFTYQTVAAPGPITGYALTGTLPLGLSFNTSTGVLGGRPAEGGIFTVQLTAANDGGTSAPQTLVINILPADNVPVITSPTFAFGIVGTDFTYSITAGGTPAFPAAPFPAPFVLDAVNLPPGLAVNPSTGVIQGKPTAAGRYVVSLVGTNSAGTGPFRDLTIEILPSPTAPVITSVPFAAGQVGTPFSYQITGTENPTSFEVLGAPAWMTVNTGTGAIAGTPAVPGTLGVTLLASNANGISSPVILSLTVAASPNAPVVTSSRAASGKVQTAFTYQITALVPTGAPAVSSYVATGLPSGLGLSSATGVISGSPLASGQFEVTLIAKSSAGDSQPVTLIITIQPNVTFVF